MKRTLKIEAEMHSDVSAHDFAEYVKEAVVGWMGGYHPDDQRQSIHNVEVKFVSNRPRGEGDGL